MDIYHGTLTLTGTTDTDYLEVQGLIEWLKITYTNGNAGTGDIVITDEASGVVIYSETNGATDVDGPVRAQAIDRSGSAKTAYERIPISSRIKAVSTGHNANTSIALDFLVSR